MDAHSTGTMPDGTSDIRSANVGDLKLAWAFGLPDVADARSQPVVTEDTLFIAATSGHLYALDRFSGCTRWHRTLDAPPRTTLTLGLAAEKPALFYGDIEAHVNAVEAATGELIWRSDATVSEHTMLTGAQVQHEDRLIVPVSLYEVGLAGDPEYECCISHGAVLALNADTGERLWATPMAPEAEPRELTSAGVQSWGPSGVPVWSTPTVDAERGLIYAGTGQNASLPATDLSDAVVALDIDTGEIAWHFQTIAGDAYNMACDQRPPGPNCPKWRGPDHDIGAAVVITRSSDGDEILIVGQKSGDIYALDPDDAGQLIWRSRVGAGSALGGVHWGLAVDDGVIYAPVADPPYPIPGYRPAPGLYALSVEDGDLLWESPVERGCETNLFEYFGRESLYPDCSFFYGLSAAPVKVNDLIFAPALDGRLYAFQADDGRIAWAFETARPFDTVNGVAAHGGSIDVAGVQTAGNMLYVQSGYSQFGQLPGNVLLAFSPR
jgi:polyvinyl alcohol dehydrogenase (cytochrome)